MKFTCFKKKYKKPTPHTWELVEDIILTPEDKDDFKDLLTNDLGMQLIKISEGYHKKNADGTCSPYLCPAGKPTIGYGTIKYRSGKRVTMDDPPMTKNGAIFGLKWEVDEKENIIWKCISDICQERQVQMLSSNQFSALVSFAYNLGTGPITQNGRTMNQALRFGSTNDIANAFLVYNKARGGLFNRLRVLPGLVTRRKAERALFLKEVE